MALYVNTNVSSLNGRTNLNKANGSLDTTYARLSSGMRINSAKDDAAGLMISDRLTSQINGLNQGNRNANDGIAVAQTAEGAMDEITNMLQRIRTLANQSATGSNTDQDRNSLQKEVTSLSEEITRIADKTTFGGKKILAGTKGSDAATGDGLLVRGKMAFQVGANSNDTISISLSTGFRLEDMAKAMGTQNISFEKGIDKYMGYSSNDKSWDMYKLNSDGRSVTKASSATTGTLKTMNDTINVIDGVGDTKKGSYLTAAHNYETALTSRDSATDGLAKIQDDDSDVINQAYQRYKDACEAHGVAAKALSDASNISAWAGTTDTNDTGTALTAALTALQTVASMQTYTYTNSKGDVEKATLSTVCTTLSNLSAAESDSGSVAAVKVELVSAESNYVNTSTMSVKSNFVTLDIADYKNQLGIIDTDALSNAVHNAFTDKAESLGYSYSANDSISINQDRDVLSLMGEKENALGKEAFAFDVGSASAAQATLAVIDNFISYVDGKRSDLGAPENRLESTISNQTSIATNESDARARIRDTDYAEEAANLSQQNIVQQAASSMLTQANSRSQLALSLLG